MVNKSVSSFLVPLLWKSLWTKVFYRETKTSCTKGRKKTSTIFIELKKPALQNLMRATSSGWARYFFPFLQSLNSLFFPVNLFTGLVSDQRRAWKIYRSTSLRFERSGYSLQLSVNYEIDCLSVLKNLNLKVNCRENTFSSLFYFDIHASSQYKALWLYFITHTQLKNPRSRSPFSFINNFRQNYLF